MNQNQSTVLIAEDMESQRELYEDFLNENGYKILTACNGVEALKIIENQKVDLVVTDAKMPEMNALDIVPRIRILRPGLPIIVVTAYPVLVDAFADQIFKVEAIFLKPVSLDDLLKKVKELLP